MGGILFCKVLDFKHYTMETVKQLNDIISKFDRLLAFYKVEKIKTIGGSAVLEHVIDFYQATRTWSLLDSLEEPRIHFWQNRS